MGRHCFEQAPSKIGIVLEIALMWSEKASNTRCLWHVLTKRRLEKRDGGNLSRA
jgi:hypothetical protein